MFLPQIPIYVEVRLVANDFSGDEIRKAVEDHLRTVDLDYEWFTGETQVHGVSLYIQIKGEPELRVGWLGCVRTAFNEAATAVANLTQTLGQDPIIRGLSDSVFVLKFGQVNNGDVAAPAAVKAQAEKLFK